MGIFDFLEKECYIIIHKDDILVDLLLLVVGTRMSTMEFVFPAMFTNRTDII